MNKQQWQEITKQLQFIQDRLEQVDMAVTAINAKLTHYIDQLEQRVGRLEAVA